MNRKEIHVQQLQHTPHDIILSFANKEQCKMFQLDSFDLHKLILEKQNEL